jgi:hypothetical protein
MLGEGMPWHIIMFFFVLGIVFGAMSGKAGSDKTPIKQ